MTFKMDVSIMKMPVEEAIVLNDDESYSIYIKRSLSPEDKLTAFLHAMIHVWNEDFFKDNVQLIECQAHDRGV